MSKKGHSTDMNSESPTAAEVNLALDYLLAHKKEFIQEFLRERSLFFSGTKSTLRRRLEGYLGDGQLGIADLVQLLDEIEGWGNQHIYLYKAPSQIVEPWLEENSARRHLDDLGLADLFNRQRPLVLPEETTLSAIEWTLERIRFVWVEKREGEERASEEDFEREGMVWRAYRVNVSRGLVAFDWDLVSGYAMLMIQRLHRGTKYSQTRGRFTRELEPIVGLNYFEPVLVSRAIQPIEASGEVRRRQLKYQTRRGGKATFTSAGRSQDTFEDPNLQRAGQALQRETASLLGNFYWLPKDTLKHELHCNIYAADQRIGIFGEHREQEIRYVLSRILHYCRGASRTR